MSRITLDLLRKRSEHNDGEISTLEEIALHQESIEKIELIEKTCKHLKILLLQHNLISRIENLGKLKKLEYLNLALNNVQVIENLEGLESLKKLDLTVNFIGDLRGVKRLRCNQHLEQLFLMGNPCADYEGYREYVVATLSQLKELDGAAIVRSERIKALQIYAEVEGETIRSYARQRSAREAEILDYREERTSWKGEERSEEEENDETFWKRTSRHTPEERVAIAERLLRKEEQRNRERDGGKRNSYVPKLFSPEGKPYNVNQPKVSFKLNDQEYTDRVVLEVALYKHLDTCYVNVDVQPEYVRVTIKGKALQLTLPCEVSVSTSTAQRNTTNGTLLVTMPRFNPLSNIPFRNNETTTVRRVERRPLTGVREYLEIGPGSNHLDFSRILARSGEQRYDVSKKREQIREDDGDSEVPPLE
ncbi:Protein TILB like protein [Habropoda laboriosa]|uniref:Protein TILB like protein n=1 Tax=Habropoda laboriosa TaxID=597456 RepID=A0A0L7RBC2_9HYME|nr:Protein TILB like protein [Habropoda laboriosa]